MIGNGYEIPIHHPVSSENTPQIKLNLKQKEK
jgi:hypothetical protein